MIRSVTSFFLLSLAITAHAVDSIEVQGLFSNKAVLLIDGKRHVLAVGEESPEGVKVISASSRGAVLEHDGKQQQYDLGHTVGTTYAARRSLSETIYKNSAGMYMTYGSINGRTVKFLVDTGASAVSMNADQARRLGIRYEEDGVAAGVSTASGFVKAYRVSLQSVSVGKITEKNVDAYVIDGSHPGPILLGMTYLGRIGVEHSGNAMNLSVKK